MRRISEVLDEILPLSESNGLLDQPLLPFEPFSGSGWNLEEEGGGSASGHELLERALRRETAGGLAASAFEPLLPASIAAEFGIDFAAERVAGVWLASARVFLAEDGDNAFGEELLLFEPESSKRRAGRWSSIHLCIQSECSEAGFTREFPADRLADILPRMRSGAGILAANSVLLTRSAETVGLAHILVSAADSPSDCFVKRSHTSRFHPLEQPREFADACGLQSAFLLHCGGFPCNRELRVEAPKICFLSPDQGWRAANSDFGFATAVEESCRRFLREMADAQHRRHRKHRRRRKHQQH